MQCTCDSLMRQESVYSVRQRLRDYYYVTKPNVISLLVFTGAASYIASAGWHSTALTLIIVSATIWLGSAAANTVGSYFDRDIDAVMKRTSSRPIPTGRIAPINAAYYGLVLLAASLILSYYFLSPLSSIAMFVGFIDYTVVYSFLLKRRSWLNIILGGFSGVMPVLVGYYATPNPVITLASALFLGFLVFFWIPEHIWSLAIRFRADYQAAKIPMLPVVIPETRSVQVIAGTTILMVAFSLLPIAFPSLSLHLIYFGFSAVLGGMMLLANIWLLRDPTAKRSLLSPILIPAGIFRTLNVSLIDCSSISHPPNLAPPWAS